MIFSDVMRKRNLGNKSYAQANPNAHTEMKIQSLRTHPRANIRSGEVFFGPQNTAGAS